MNEPPATMFAAGQHHQPTAPPNPHSSNNCPQVRLLTQPNRHVEPSQRVSLNPSRSELPTSNGIHLNRLSGSNRSGPQKSTPNHHVRLIAKNQKIPQHIHPRLPLKLQRHITIRHSARK